MTASCWWIIRFKSCSGQKLRPVIGWSLLRRRQGWVLGLCNDHDGAKRSQWLQNYVTCTWATSKPGNSLGKATPFQNSTRKKVSSAETQWHISTPTCVTLWPWTMTFSTKNWTTTKFLETNFCTKCVNGMMYDVLSKSCVSATCPMTSCPPAFRFYCTNMYTDM